MDDTNGLDRVLFVSAQSFFDHLRVDSASPTLDPGQAEKLRIEPKPVRHLLPKRCKVTGLEHQHGVTRAQCIRKRRFPRPGSRRRVDHDRLLRFEDFLDSFKHLQSKLAKFRAAVIDSRIAHRAQDAVWYRARSDRK